MNLVTPDSGLLFWMVLIFAIVLIILAKWGFPAITGMVEKRTNHIQESLKLAQEAEQRMQDMAAEQAELLEKTKKEQAAVIKEATQTKAQIIAQAKVEAQEEAANMISKAKAEIAAEKESALSDIRREVAMLSVDVAEKVLRKKLDGEAAQSEYLSRLVDEMSKQDIENNKQ